MTTLYLYELAPLDWFGTAVPHAMLPDLLPDLSALEELGVFLTAAMSAVRKAPGINWEGDASTGPFVGVPKNCHVITVTTQEFRPPEMSEITVIVGFVWKQRNNGTCFIVSLDPVTANGVVSSVRVEVREHINRDLLRLKGVPILSDSPDELNRDAN